VSSAKKLAHTFTHQPLACFSEDFTLIRAKPEVKDWFE